MAAAGKTSKRPARGLRAGSMTDDHKQALARGRDESRAVRAYLEALHARPPKKRGRKRSVDAIRKELDTLHVQIEGARSITLLQLLQQRRELFDELAAAEAGEGPDLEALRVAFVKAAKAYGERKGISYETWREIGVDAATLQEAGIRRGRS